MNSTVLRVGLVTGTAALLLLGVGVAATAVARSSAADTNAVLPADGALTGSDDALAGPGGILPDENAGQVPDGDAWGDGSAPGGDGGPAGGRGDHRAGPPGGGELAVPPEEPRVREEGEGQDLVPDGAGPDGDGSSDDAGTGLPELAG